jgi:hypothetical protein
MRLIALLLAAGLGGCAHTPWGYNFSRNGEIPESYRADKAECHDQAWSDAGKEVSTPLNDVFIHLFDKGIVKCMEDKGYKRVNDVSRIYRIASNEAVQVGRE